MSALTDDAWVSDGNCVFACDKLLCLVGSTRRTGKRLEREKGTMQMKSNVNWRYASGGEMEDVGKA
jgi:hypothetical protein